MSFPALSSVPGSAHIPTHRILGQAPSLLPPRVPGMPRAMAQGLQSLRSLSHPSQLTHSRPPGPSFFRLPSSLTRPGPHFRILPSQQTSALHQRRGPTAGATPCDQRTASAKGSQFLAHPTLGNELTPTRERTLGHSCRGGHRSSRRGVTVRCQRHTGPSSSQIPLSTAGSDTNEETLLVAVPDEAQPGAYSTEGAGSQGTGSRQQAVVGRRQAILGALCLAPALAVSTAVPGASLGADSAVDLGSSGSTLGSTLAPDVGSDLGLTLWRRESQVTSLAAQAAPRGNGVLSGLAAVSDIDAETVRRAVRGVLSPPKCPGALRLAFHDAGTFDEPTGTGGMNGSIIFELDRPESNGLKRTVKILTKAKEELAAQGLDVSWADIIAVGGAEAVEMCGGPHISLRLGRTDSGKADEPGRMPAETLNAEEVIKSFASKGFSVQETVVLLGAHTLGGKGFGDATAFDNSYFSILLQRPWNDASNKMAYMIGLPSDKAIVENDGAQRWIETYADDQKRFYKDFAVAYVKLVDSGAAWQA